MSADLLARPAAARNDAMRAERPVLCASLVPATLGLAFSLAVSADALLRNGPAGTAFPVWIAMTVASLAGLAWRGGLTVSREATMWLSTAMFFSIGLAWRDADALQAYDFLATIGALVMAAAALNAPRPVAFAPRIRHTIRAAARTMGTLAAGFPMLLFRDAAAHSDSERWQAIFRRALRVSLVAGALTLVFGSLLGSADPIFASFVTIPSLDAPALVRHAIIIGVLAWAIGGWARGALVDKSDRLQRTGATAWQLGTLEITSAFTTLIVLFGAFVVAQLGWLFGGEAFLRARTGLTAAGYARQGFFQMVLVVTLVIPLLVVTRSALRPSWALARRHTMLALPVVALLGAIVISAALRMRLYVQYYGLSTDRVYPLVFMGWLAFVLVWLSITTLRGRARRFGPGVVVSAFATLGGLNVVVPDAVVARVNIARSAADNRQPLDVQYLSTLSGEAAEPAIQAILADARSHMTLTEAEAFPRCAMLNGVHNRWGADSPAQTERTHHGAWRSWNAGEAHALRVVSKYGDQLEAFRQNACVRAKVVKP